VNLEKLVLPLEVADSAFNAGLKVAAAGVGAIVGAMGLAIKATFNWADELDKIGDIMGVTDKEAAALNFTLRKSGVATETLTKGMTILSKGLVKADGTLDTTGKSLKTWGINVLDANGGLKDQTTLLDEISDKYNTFGTQQEKINFLTEVFGRNGAEMIDFFDTLAGEGGLDAVSKKVEALGLAIDPDRYEQFNRNLEELKMIGLGLAVAFTENVMPLLEKFLGWIGEAAQSQEWADFKAGFNEFTSEIATAISEGDWETVKNLIFEKLNLFDDWIAEKLDAMDWTGAGTSFGLALDKIMDNGVGQVNVPDSLQSLLDGINEFFLSATGADQFGGWETYFAAWGEQIETGMNNLEVQGTNAVRNLFNNMEIAGTGAVRSFMDNLEIAGTDAVRNFFNNWEKTWTAAIQNWGASVYNKVIEWVNKIIAAINQVANIGMPALPSAGGASAGGASGARSNSPRGGRASGGPVIAGQTYDVAEFFRPERFTPSTNGRIDPIDNLGGGDLTPILREFAYEISRANRDMFEKTGRH
jgi:hypothetical protein